MSEQNQLLKKVLGEKYLTVRADGVGSVAHIARKVLNGEEVKVYMVKLLALDKSANRAQGDEEKRKVIYKELITELGLEVTNGSE